MDRVIKILWIMCVIWIVFFVINDEKRTNIDEKSEYLSGKIMNNDEIFFSNTVVSQVKNDYNEEMVQESVTEDSKKNRNNSSKRGSISEMFSSYTKSGTIDNSIDNEEQWKIWWKVEQYEWNLQTLGIKKVQKMQDSPTYSNHTQGMGDNINDDISERWVSIGNNDEIVDENTMDTNNDEDSNILENYDVESIEDINLDNKEKSDYISEWSNLNIYKNSWFPLLMLKKSAKIETNNTSWDSDMKDLENYKDKLEIYNWDLISLNLKYSKSRAKQFDIEDSWLDSWLSDDIIQELLDKEDIDVKSLESENDEFLQRIFEETRDSDVLNTILKTYISEYQFSKAKKYIENLPEMYREQIDPYLYLNIYFNSFSLSSKTITTQLNSIIDWYRSSWKINEWDALWYRSIISLMQKNYDNFYEISKWFTSNNHIQLVEKLKWYQEQIKNQKWMPEYYFDTLVSLELFNNWFFQVAKVLALSSLQKNSNYILPYQVLAYANFLTNSRDTSIEYLKKLIDLDPNNAEKYRFLMWVAYYWNEKYEQSIVMLSLIKDDKLRLDAQRYLINNYLLLNQKNKLITNWKKLLWYQNLSASDFYTYFYESFYRPYSLWEQFDIYVTDMQLAEKMIRVCNSILSVEESVVCTYGSIWKNIAEWRFDNLEKSLLDLVNKYPQWYLYQALWEYYIKNWDLDRAKVYLLKAVSLTQNRWERSQIKKLLQDAM